MSSNLFPVVSSRLGYDAEYHLGLVPNEQSAAGDNSNALDEAFAAMYLGGDFTYIHGASGFFMKPIVFPGMEYFLSRPIKLPTRVGAQLYGLGGIGAQYLAGEFSELGNLGGCVTRLTRVDGQADSAIMRVRGAGVIAHNFMFSGRRLVSAGEPYYDSEVRTGAAIQIEGRNAIATGICDFQNITVMECTYGIQALRGYYNDDDEFVQEENHADQVMIRNMHTYGVSSCIRLDNEQAVGWKIEGLRVNQGYGQNEDTVVFDVDRGGDLYADTVTVNHGKATVLRVNHYSQNCKRIVIRNIKRDRIESVYTPADYYTLFWYDPSTVFEDMSGFKWTVRMDGSIAQSALSPNYNPNQMIRVPTGNLPLGNLRFDIDDVPVVEDEGDPPTGWTLEGRWLIPTNDLKQDEYTLEEGITSFYPLNEEEDGDDALDHAGSVTLASVNDVESGAGFIGSTAREFTADDEQYFTVDDNSALSLGGDIDFQGAIWFKIKGVAGDNQILFAKDNISDSREYALYYYHPTQRLVFEVGNGSGMDQVIANSFGALSLDTWYMAFFGRNAEDGEIFLSIDNGTKNTASNTTTVNTSAVFQLGARQGASFFNGLMQHLVIWKGRVLTEEEEDTWWNGGDGVDLT